MIAAVSRALTVLDALSADTHGASVSDLAQRLGIEKSIISRILSTLESDGYVIRDPTRDAFHMSYKFAALALRHIDQIGIHDLCVPLLQELADKTGELVQLALVEGEKVRYVAKAEGADQRIRMLSLIGREAVLHASSAGKVWLASFDDEAAIRLARRAGLRRFTGRTITTVDGLRKELARVRKDGYALTLEELFDGANTVGVPLRHRSQGHLIGALVVSGPSFRLPKERLRTFVPDLLQLAQSFPEFSHHEVRWVGKRNADGRHVPAFGKDRPKSVA